jgi:2-dehydro-3-deoxy-L-rhamnonate dehydrogenase (NAD+)
MELRGRGAIITGASQGLGREIACRFVEAGASVLLVSRGDERLQQTQTELLKVAGDNQQVLRLSGDVAEPTTCAAIVECARERLPNLCILVNNAGIYGPIGRIEDVEWKDWAEAMRINLFGTALMCRAVIPSMHERGYGKIINLSGGGATAPMPYFSAYAASKAAVVRLTETLAEELRGTRIDVNVIAPGALNTRLLDQVLVAGPEKAGRAFHERALKQRDEGGVPLERGAALTVFLASADSDGISGRLLSAVWDDWRNLPARREQLAASDIYTLRRIVPEDRREKWCA